MFRRSVKYKHRYSTPISPVESFEEEIPSPFCNSQPEKSDQNVELQEELSGKSRRLICPKVLRSFVLALLFSMSSLKDQN